MADPRVRCQAYEAPFRCSLVEGHVPANVHEHAPSGTHWVDPEVSGMVEEFTAELLSQEDDLPTFRAAALMVASERIPPNHAAATIESGLRTRAMLDLAAVLTEWILTGEVPE